MLISSWMTRDVITVTPETSVNKANKLMQDHDIRRLPVLDTQRNVVGIVSDRDVKAALPSKATTLEVHELQYLLSELKVKEIMTVKPVCVSPGDTVEKVAMLMEEKGFGGLPVTEDDKLVGIITDHDIFKVLINITGARQGGTVLAFEVPDERGNMRDMFDTLRSHEASIISILSHNEDIGDRRRVFVRIRPMSSEDKLSALIVALKDQHGFLYSA